MSTAVEDRNSRRLAWCVAQVLRHAPDHIALALLGRLDWPTRKYLTRDEWLPASAVTLLLRHGSEADRHFIARNPRVVGRPLPGLPGPARYARRRTPPELLPVLRAELGRDPADGPLTGTELIGLLRRHGIRRPRVALDILRLPYDLDPELPASEHARRPLPDGSAEALLLVADLPAHTVRALLAAPVADAVADAGTAPDGRSWHRPAVRAVRMGRLTHEELVGCVAPARRTLLLGHLPAYPGLRWTLPEQAGMRTAVTRALAPLGDDPRLWSELLRHAPGFPGPLPELVAAVLAGGPSGPAGPAAPDEALVRAVRQLAPTAAEPATGGVERELALASLAVPMETVEEDIRWVRDCLDRGLLTGADVVRHKLPACWALDEDHWLGDVDHPDHHDRPQAVLAARAEADRLFALALGEDPEAWWRVARTLPDFAGTLPHLLLRVTDGDSVSTRP
ncbi:MULTISPECIES: hypothetical protein [unclassified Streptomyces]|uniref:hypothetical protein n=1 Tax=unclassified Streptomyces TaxID=2593676 RepID=UPI00225C2377|nr:MULTISPECIES: hypothetical protein [unclassified Streptomyces]MCX4528426.1 hypothetical protein [Streptomyces sp. NBC_01551]MCX4540975.1 hypothetical protein [Streptomyces sp. NBC_01565]